MSTATSHSRRATGRLLAGLAAGLAAGALLSGCGGAQTPTTPAAATRPATAAADTPDLATGLLQAQEFAADATTTPVPLDRLGAMASMAAPSLPGVDVEPPGCLEAVRAVLPQLTGVGDAAAQVARSAGTVSVEALVVPTGGLDAVGTVQQLAGACPAADVTARTHGSAHLTVAVVPVPADAGLPDRTAVVAITATATGADGRSWSGTALAGVVEDGARVLALAQAAPRGGQPSSASFTDLLSRAYRAQAAALD